MAMSSSHPMRKYSWWWDSHISPKNSKWLQENLTDMDSKIKVMIKIIDEDADSFARRAEMYYKRRPELMSLLEELYRAYRALAERYDHAAGELRQTNRRMAEAFPDEYQLDLDDDLPAESASPETGADTCDMTPFFLSFINTGDSKKRAKDDQDHEKLQKEISSLSKENQDLKKKISSVLEKSDQAESEVRGLKESLAQQEAEKEAARSQCQQSSDRLQNLKSEILHTQEEFNRLKEEMQTGLQNLSSAEERCLLLERANQNLLLELDKLKHNSKERHDELNEKHVELEKLSITIQEEQLKSMQAEMARLSLEKQLSHAQEKLRLLALEKHSETSKINDIESTKVLLQKELEKIREENRKLDDQNHSSTSVIIRLQDEIISLKNSQRRLEEEVSRHVEEKKVLQHELSHLKDDRCDMDRKHFSIREQIQVVNFNVESLQSLAQEVRDGNVELKETIKSHEGMKTLYVENLMQLERTLEKNAHLERSLSVSTTEIEGLREKKASLEETCKHLNSKISDHQSERAMLIARIEGISNTMEKLSEKNVLLENLLSDNNTELDILRKKLKELEESTQTLRNQNSVLRSEKRTLVREVDSMNNALLSLETQYTELEGRHLDLEQDKNKAVAEVFKLQELLRLEKEKHKELTNSGMTQFNSIQKQIGLLVEEVRRRENQLQEEDHKIVEAQTEIFVLQKCLGDMAEANSDVLAKLQKQQEACNFQEEKVASLSQNNQKLTEGIGSVMEVLHLDEKYGSRNLMKIDVVVQLILHEIKCLLNTISDAQDVKQNQILEKSLVVTLLEHFGREVADLRSERSVLKQEWQAKNEELLQLQSERHDLLKISCELRKEMDARNRKVDELKSEAKFLVRQLSELHESRQSLQAEVIKLIEENSSLSSKLYDSKEKEKSSEDDFSILLCEVVKRDILGVIFRSLHDERTSQLQCLHEDFGSLHAAGNELYQEIKLMNKKLGDLQLENNYLEKELSRTLSICDGSSGEISIAKRRAMRRDTKLLKSGRKSQDSSMNVEQRKEVDNAGLEKSNEMLREELHKLQCELQVLRSKEQPVIDVKSCDAEITKLLANMQLATANAALFKEKVLELIVACESFEISDMIQKEVLKEEITRRNSYVDELKDKLNAVEIENRRLKVDLNGDFTVLGALQTEVSALEKQTLSLAKDCLPPHMLRKEENQMSPQLSKICVKPSDDQNATKMVKDMELQKLHGTIKALQKVVTDTGVVLEQERLDFNSNLQDARKQIEILKLKEILDSDASDANYDRIMKDIQLDLVQTPSRRTASHRHRKKTSPTHSDDKMLALWSVGRVSSGSHRNDIDLRPPQSEAPVTDKVKKRCSSEPVVMKDLSVDKQELLPKPVATTEPHREWKKKVIDRLSSEAQRLGDLRSIVQELRASVESTADNELEAVKVQMVDAEDAIAELIDANGKLLKKAEEFTSAADGDVDLRSRSQRKILERVRKMSEKAGRLELELQRFQHALLKHEEERAARRAAKTTVQVQRRSRVQLVEYLYGRRRENRRPKQKQRGPSCCMRAKAIDD